MISKISAINSVSNYIRPTFKAEEKTNQLTEKPVTDKPIAINNYEIASIGLKNKLKISPLNPIIDSPKTPEEIEGEKIYTSNGELCGIVYETEDFRTVYNVYPETNNMYRAIYVTDKKTGNLVTEQFNTVTDGKYENITIYKNDPKTGKEIARTIYEDGELEGASKTLYNEDGSSTEIYFDYDDKEYHVREYSKDDKIIKSVSMNEDMKFITVSKTTRNKTKETDTVARYYNGALYNIEKTTNTLISNIAGLEPLSDKDIAYEEIKSREELQNLAESIEGEKTYFSNGVIESVKGKLEDTEAKASFNPNGEVIEINIGTEKYDLGFYNHALIKENEDGSRKEIEYHKDGSVGIYYEKDNKYKEVNYSKNGEIMSYEEGEIEEDGEIDSSLSLFYNNKGMLESAYNF